MSLQSELLSTSTSVGDLLRQRVAKTPDLPAFLDPDRAPEGPNTWRTYTWAETMNEVSLLAAGFLSRGLSYEQRVGIIATTRVEWIFVDLAVGCAAGATTTVYPNTGADEVEFILTDCEAVAVVVEDATQLAKVQESAELTAQFHTIVVIDPEGVSFTDTVISLAQLSELGRAHLAAHPAAVEDAIDSTGHDTLSTLIYTSGTTGRPKGVRLNHISWVYEAAATRSYDLLSPDDVQYLWLPLSHVFGKVLIAVQLAYGFASAVDGRIDRIVVGLGEIKPTFMCGAPRIFEKVRVAVLTGNTGIKAAISRWAFSVGAKARDYRIAGKPLPRVLGAQNAVADKLVFSKLRERLGGRIRFMISGSAKLNPTVQLWFYSAGLLVIEGYGATETSAIAFLNLPTHPRFGTIGHQLPGMEAKIAEDGELLMRGPIITPGYHNLPEKTAEVLDADGWYRTGDIAERDDEGYYRITERKNDMFKTSGGKWIAPQKVEGAITANIPYVSQAVAVGSERKYCSALLVMDPQLLQKWADKHDLGALSYAELTQRPEIRESVDKLMDRANSRLEHWETVKRFAILDHELTLENSGLTANMKIRRNRVQEGYSDIIDSLYDKED
ncbi:MAG: AMP-dependent synthetase/ligase [Arachnia sp.]